MQEAMLDEYKSIWRRFSETGNEILCASMETLWALLNAEEQTYLWAWAECVEGGCNEKLADMLARQQPPCAVTDATFLRGNDNGSQFQDNPDRGDYLKRVAEEGGQMVKGKKYLAQLARFPGDPEAWVDGRGDVERVCRKRGWGCDGAVNVPTEIPRRHKKKPKPLAQKFQEAGLPVGE